MFVFWGETSKDPGGQKVWPDIILITEYLDLIHYMRQQSFLANTTFDQLFERANYL